MTKKKLESNSKKVEFKKLPWFRMYGDAVNDDKLRLLAFEDRWHFVALLCCKLKGVLDDSNPEMVRRRTAVLLGLSARELDEVARRLSEVDLIDRDTLQPVKWDDLQYRSDSSTERVREYRERQKQDTKRNGNVSVTVQDTDTDTDTEKTSHIKGASSAKKPVLVNGKWHEVDTGEESENG